MSEGPCYPVWTEHHQAIADRVAREWLPDTGPCGLCGDTVTGARHRVADAIVEYVITELKDTK